jgi:hypothetical protein
MSEEMVTRTADSPAAAPGNVGGALMDFVRENAAPDNDGFEALNNEPVFQSDDFNDDVSDVFNQTDVETRVRQKLLDTVVPEKPASVPYDRFREVNEEAKALRQQQEALERWKDVITQFESSGFKSAADVQKALQQQEIARQEQGIRDRWQQKVNTEYFDPQAANAYAEAEINKFRYDQVVSQMNNYMISQQRVEAYEQFPYARRAEDVVEQLIGSGISPIEAARAVHNQVQGLVESLVPELLDMVTERQNVPTPIDTSASAQPVVQPQQPQRNALSGITRLLGIGR